MYMNAKNTIHVFEMGHDYYFVKRKITKKLTVYYGLSLLSFIIIGFKTSLPNSQKSKFIYSVNSLLTFSICYKGKLK